MKVLAIISLILHILADVAVAGTRHILGWAPTSKKWDLRTTMVVTAFRTAFRRMMAGFTLSELQAATLKDPGVRGKVWVAKATIESPEDGSSNLERLVSDAIEEMKPTPTELMYTPPTFARPGVDIEWTGF